MNADRYKIISPNDLADYREQAGNIAEISWPEFMLQDLIANEHWHELFDRFNEYQFALLDTEMNRMAAMANSLPFFWDKPLEDLPEGGWDWVFLQAIEDHKKSVKPNIQSAIQINIHPEYQSQGLSSIMVQAMRGIGKTRGFQSLVAPVRPNQKSKYPLTSIDDYITWETDGGLPFDAWGALIASLLLGTATLSILGGIGAALTVGVRRGSVLLSLLVLPLAMPLLIFGSRAVGMVMDGDSPSGPLQLLAAIFFLTLSLGPVAMSAAIRISVES